MAGLLLSGNSQDRLPRSHRGSSGSPLGATTSRDHVVMQEVSDCRRAADQVGGDTVCQHKVTAHAKVLGPAHAQTTASVPNAPPIEGPFVAGGGLPSSQVGGSTQVAPLLL